MAPKVMGGRLFGPAEPPLGMYAVPWALIVTEEGLRLWSLWLGAPLATLLLLTIAGPLMLGTAGWTGAFPLIGGIEFVFPWCGGRAPPMADSGLGAFGVVPGAAVGEAAAVVVTSAGVDVIR
jgi:hypothetical protein